MIRAVALLALLAAPAVAGPPRLESDALARDAARTAPSPAVRRVTAGRVAGASVDCIDQGQAFRVRVVDATALMWQDRASRFWLNQPPRGCPSLRGDRQIATRTLGNRLCAGDMVRVLSAGGSVAGLCRLGRFIPWTRP